jgi:L-threonylcarbamoyladenylate synthase
MEVVYAYTISGKEMDADVIARGAKLLRTGKLVAFPTETVYGIGANALSADAVGRIFAAKGRPSNNPVIVHVPDIAAARKLVTAWPEAANRLAHAFWPGPLTLVLPKQDSIPDIVTAGGPTVAVRIPAHPVALALLRAAAIPIAAPSANRSMQLSPTTAEHVRESLDGRIDMIVDGGPTTGGIESTVLSLAGAWPRLLRPGLISPAQIEAVIGPIERSPKLNNPPTDPNPKSDPFPSPGMLARHYAPRAPLEVVEAGESRVRHLLADGRRVGWLTRTEAGPEFAAAPRLVVTQMPDNPEGYASRLYAALHTMDDSGVSIIVVEALPATDDWLALRDRLTRASTKD